MSRLHYSEEGRVLSTLCEELTRFRIAQKAIDLPATDSPATLYLLARCHSDNDTPMHLSVNGSELNPIAPEHPGSYYWYRVSVDPELLTTGENQFEVWAETTAMDGWALALEAGHPQPRSAISDDGGASWRRKRMGYLNAVLGEYVVRIRLEEGCDPAPPPIVWEQAEHPRLVSLREQLPAVINRSGTTMDKVRTLTTWLSSSWEHTGGSKADQYAPWDAETLLSWAPRKVGHNSHPPIAMCVHYAAAFVSAAQAIGMPARCAVVTGGLNSPKGHFVAEVWDPDLNKWWVADPNVDAVFVDGSTPMSMSEIQNAGTKLGRHIEYGPGTDYQCTFPHMVTFVQDMLETGICFAHRSVWYRADLLSRPDLSPPGHGAVTYCETGLIWEQRDREHGFDPFPLFGDFDYFDAPPNIPKQELLERTYCG